MQGGEQDQLVDWLARSARGDRAAFQALYRATSAKLFGTILRILGDRDLSRDVTQETYVKIWHNAARYDPAKSSPITWMAAIARNRALDEARRRQPPAADIDDVELEVPGDNPDPLAARARREELRRLIACLDGLDAERRQAVLLAYCHGLSREALAQRFARPVGTIKVWLHRSLAQLRECLGS
ncbi:sigma-70 family RNA polymerase sigma factor [Chelatococcus sp. SYSU_G07232]|uniref:Sigma-70 family RNA polymerase sigma factor n=1 Tax=Chelatococcus albus TaxID=3047466 RepID=A0ABT7AKJ5_9HYPH|nr:sigma-70 family RNA polymerase sigma factor [Chelatococcus sp. SYSU_G07232]MDJ1159502.1 sigma-70 family RNA polymerase sigma factor [Chelatococcus sp. SYSU_G07232]